MFTEKSWTNKYEHAAANQVAAGDPANSLYNTDVSIKAIDKITKIDPADYMTLVVDGWSMYPEGISDGDILLCEEVNKETEMNLENGKYVIIEVDKAYYRHMNKIAKYDLKLRKTVCKVAPHTTFEKLLIDLAAVDDSILLKENQILLKKKYEETYRFYNHDHNCREMMLSITYDEGRLRYSFHPTDSIKYIARYVADKDCSTLTEL